MPMICFPKTRLAAALLAGFCLALAINVRSAGAPPHGNVPADDPAGPRRISQTFSHSEVFQAIADEFGRRGIHLGQVLQPGDLRIQAMVPAPDGGYKAALAVTRMRYDAIRREVVFEIRDTRQPQYLPFQVTTRRDPQSLGLASLEGWDSAASGVGTKDEASGRLKKDRIKAPVLAKPGIPATLVILGQHVRITMTVDPLQPGSKGQAIRVRDLATGRVLMGEVMDQGQLQAGL